VFLLRCSLIQLFGIVVGGLFRSSSSHIEISCSSIKWQSENCQWIVWHETARMSEITSCISRQRLSGQLDCRTSQGFESHSVQGQA